MWDEYHVLGAGVNVVSEMIQSLFSQEVYILVGICDNTDINMLVYKCTHRSCMHRSNTVGDDESYGSAFVVPVC